MDLNLSGWGLLGLVDPLRPEVPAAIKACQGAGIRIVMITGDHPITAAAMAEQAGIAAADVYARVTPIKKLEIIQRLKAEGEVVAMTGDGVNDAPALKSAHIGIAMGKRGTDVAREAAALVLMEDSFTAIVGAIKAGRMITKNIKLALSYSLSLHMPIILLSIVPVVMNQALILLPVHIVFLELVFNPIASLLFEAEPADRDLMQQPPVPIKTELLNGRSLFRALTVGGLMGGGLLILYLWLLMRGVPTEEIRTAVFTAMVGANLGAVFIFRRRWFFSRLPRIGWIAMALTMTGLTVIVHLPILAQLFMLGKIGVWHYGLTHLGAFGLAGAGRVFNR